MVRETIILSNLDMKLMEFLNEERIVQDILDEFDFSFSQSRLHVVRLERLKCVDVEKYGGFKKIKLNKKGIEVLNFLKCMV